MLILVSSFFSCYIGLIWSRAGKRVLYSCWKLCGAQFCAGWSNWQRGEKKKTHPVLSSKVTKNKQVDSVGSVRKVTTLRLRVAFIAALCSGKAHISVKADEVVENSEEFKY